jgi:hypothetical protein
MMRNDEESESSDNLIIFLSGAAANVGKCREMSVNVGVLGGGVAVAANACAGRAVLR